MKITGENEKWASCVKHSIKKLLYHTISVKCSQTIALICGYAIFLCRMQTSSNLGFFLLFRFGVLVFTFLIKWWILVDFELSFYIVIICSLLFSFNKSWCELFSSIRSLGSLAVAITIAVDTRRKSFFFRWLDGRFLGGYNFFGWI